MKKGLSEIACIIDSSGSMQSMRDDAIGGFNAFLEGQKEVDGEARMSLVTFANQYNMVIDSVELNEVPELTTESYRPSGGTALLDAIGITIDKIGKRLRDLDESERPESVIIAIMTDGGENASQEYTAPDQIKKMIEHQENKYNWKFLYLAANQDAFAVGSTFGFTKGNSITISNTGRGIANAYDNMNLYSSSVRYCADVSNFATDMAIKEEDSVSS